MDDDEQGTCLNCGQACDSTQTFCDDQCAAQYESQDGEELDMGGADEVAESLDDEDEDQWP